MKIYMTFHADPYEVMKCRKYPNWKIKAILAWILLLRKHGPKSYTTCMTLRFEDEYSFPTFSPGLRDNRTIFCLSDSFKSMCPFDRNSILFQILTDRELTSCNTYGIGNENFIVRKWKEKYTPKQVE